ncbi:nicotinate-nucleotide--dimethylbenzimidazole phosphoribosyltransferase [Furfurilactobacillus sp. WILCCON 0119]
MLKDDWQTMWTCAPISVSARRQMQQKLDELAKPIRGLGRLEDLAVQLAGIKRQVTVTTAHRELLVFAADHGVAAEHVSATPQVVTALQAVNTVNGQTTVATMCQAAHCAVTVVDVGIMTPINEPQVLNRKIRFGTSDLLTGPAMTKPEAIQAITIGYETAQTAVVTHHAEILAIGELGIGNTTAAAAIIAALLHADPAAVVGRGSNISDQRLRHKQQVVTASLQRSFDHEDARDVLANVGGFEIGAMTGALLYAARFGVPIVLDGFISYAALLIAERLKPGVTNYVIPSHESHERGSQLVLEALQLKPYFNLALCVGEGTGAVMLLSWLDLLQAVLTNMNTAADVGFDFTK